jgi:hypothetical protein
MATNVFGTTPSEQEIRDLLDQLKQSMSKSLSFSGSIKPGTPSREDAMKDPVLAALNDESYVRLMRAAFDPAKTLEEAEGSLTIVRAINDRVNLYIRAQRTILGRVPKEVIFMDDETGTAVHIEGLDIKKGWDEMLVRVPELVGMPTQFHSENFDITEEDFQLIRSYV